MTCGRTFLQSGVDTIKQAADSGCRCIALGSGRVILLDAPAVIEAANAAGVALVAFAMNETQFVSRAGLKLEHALNEFDFDVTRSYMRRSWMQRRWVYRLPIATRRIKSVCR